jgi:hypothetical protein
MSKIGQALHSLTIFTIRFCVAKYIPIFVRIRGGIGNQFFQFAAAIALQQKFGGKIVLLTDWYSSSQRGLEFDQFRRTFELDKLKSQKNVKVISDNNVANKIEHICRRIANIFSETLIFIDKNEKTQLLRHRRLYIEGTFLFCLEHEPLKDLLLSKLKLADELHKNSINYIKKSNKRSLGIHIRRGDNVIQNTLLLPKDYYLNAVEYFANLDLDIVIFSDDPKWCNLQKEFAEWRICSNLSDIEQLFAMALCDYLIISSSTFSWWSAFLNESSMSNNIIRPYPFWDTHELNTFDNTFLPASWVKLSKFGN